MWGMKMKMGVSLLVAATGMVLMAAEEIPDYDEACEAYLRGDYQCALDTFREAVSAGSAEAQLNLSVMYYLGQGVPENSVSAYMWATLAMENGIPRPAKLRNVYADGLDDREIAVAHSRAKLCSSSDFTICE
jgi:TPR repeat protein